MKGAKDESAEANVVVSVVQIEHMIYNGGVYGRTGEQCKEPNPEARRESVGRRHTLTLTLGGNVPLDLFAQTMQRFERLIDLLTREVSRDAGISWSVDELAAGSAVVTIRGEAEHPEAVERVGRAFSVVGHALERNETIPYSSQIGQAARSITAVINGRIPFVQFDGGSDVATITSGIPVEQASGVIGAHGSIEGRIETLLSRRRLGFTLYDSLSDRAIQCHLQPEQVDLVRNAWGHRALVQGWIQRHPATGQPVLINPVRSIDVLPDVEPGSYRRARAILPVSAGEPSANVAIRRLRDA